MLDVYNVILSLTFSSLHKLITLQPIVTAFGTYTYLGNNITTALRLL